MTTTNRIFALGTLLCLLIAGFVMIATPQATGLGKFVARDPVCYGSWDPIVNHNHAGPSPHEHLFVGATAICGLPNPNAANYKDLAGKGTNLDNPDDTAAYWIPVLVLTDGWQGTRNLGRIPNSGFRNYFAYYRCFNRDRICSASDRSIAHPADTRLVVGNPAQPANVPLDTRWINWTCGEDSSRRGPYTNIETANCATATGTRVNLTMHVTFPSCWDGVLPNHSASDMGDTRDNAHYAFANRRTDTCPSTHPVKVTELRETFKWGDNTPGYWRNKYPALTTDLMQRQMGNPVKAGQTAHADFWNTWEQKASTPGTPTLHGGFDGMVQDCINTAPEPYCNN